MKEHPIIFCSDMVSAILNGGKTQTRRIFNPERIVISPHKNGGFYYHTFARRKGELVDTGQGGFTPNNWLHYCPYGQVGDRLWVRETWRVNAIGNYCREHSDHKTCEVEYATLPGCARGNREFYCVTDEELQKANRYYDKNHQGGFNPSIHMPHWASRITLEIYNIRVERVQDISEQDAKAEGVQGSNCKHGYDYCLECGISHKANFSSLWDSINIKRGYSWISNPWVWVIEFKKVKND